MRFHSNTTKKIVSKLFKNNPFNVVILIFTTLTLEH